MDHVHNHNPSHLLTVYVEDDEVQIPLDRPDALTADLAEDYARRIKGDVGIWGATDDGYVIVPARAIRYMELAEVAKEAECEDDQAAEPVLSTLSGVDPRHAAADVHMATYPTTPVQAPSPETVDAA